MDADDQCQIMMFIQLTAERHAAKKNRDTPLPFPPQREVMQCTEGYVAGNYDHSQFYPLRCAEIRDCQTKQPFLPDRYRQQIKHPADCRRIDASIEKPGIGNQRPENQYTCEQVAARLGEQAGHGFPEERPHLRNEQTQGTQQRPRQAVAQQHLAESIEADSGEVRRALQPTLARSEPARRIGVVRAKQRTDS